MIDSVMHKHNRRMLHDQLFSTNTLNHSELTGLFSSRSNNIDVRIRNWTSLIFVNLQILLPIFQRTKIELKEANACWERLYEELESVMVKLSINFPK